MAHKRTGGSGLKISFQVSRALTELRERGQDRDWLQAVVEYLHDREARESDALRKGISQLQRGQLEPA